MVNNMASKQAPLRYIKRKKDKYTVSLKKFKLLCCMHPSFKSLMHTIGRLDKSRIDNLVTSTLGLTYYSHDRTIISKIHGGYQVINLLTCLPVSRETSNGIVHLHFEIALLVLWAQAVYMSLIYLYNLYYTRFVLIWPRGTSNYCNPVIALAF